MTDPQQLTQAVRELTAATVQLRKLLEDEYPRRSEVERRFVSKLAQQRHFSRMVVLALVVVVSCYVVNIGSYSACFVGDLGSNPSICKLVPGYKERVARTQEVNRIHGEQERRIKRLENQLGIASGGNE